MNCYPNKLTPVVAHHKCPTCGHPYMMIHEDGTFRCGSCLRSGMICCEKLRHLLDDEEIKKKVKNDYVFKTKVCHNCRAIITEKLCPHCKKLNVED